MAHNVYGQSEVEVNHLGNLFEIAGDGVAGVAVVGALVDAYVLYDGQEILTDVLGVFVKDYLHFRRPSDRTTASKLGLELQINQKAM